MWSVVTDRVVWSVCLSVWHSRTCPKTLYRELCKNGWTAQDARWFLDSGGPSERGQCGLMSSYLDHLLLLLLLLVAAVYSTDIASQYSDWTVRVNYSLTRGSQVHKPNGISIGSAVFTGHTIMTYWLTASVTIGRIYVGSTAMWPTNDVVIRLPDHKGDGPP